MPLRTNSLPYKTICIGSQNINCCQLKKKLKCNTVTQSLQPQKTVSKFMWVSEQSDSCYAFNFRALLGSSTTQQQRHVSATAVQVLIILLDVMRKRLS